MSDFLNKLSDGCVNIEKCGDVVVSPKDNMIGMFCHFCCDIYTNLSEFLHHLQWMHNDVLGFAKAHNVYSVEELMALTDAQEDVDSSSSDSGIPADRGDAMTAAEPKTRIGMNHNILNALAAYDVHYKKTKASQKKATSKNMLQWQAEAEKCLPVATDAKERDVLAEVEAMLLEDELQPQKEDTTDHGMELQEMLQAAGLPDIQLDKEQSMPKHLEHKLTSDSCKVNFNEKQLNLKRRNWEAVKIKSEKPRSTCDLKSYTIARSARKREQHQRLNNIKKRIVRSLESETHKPQRMPIKVACLQQLHQLTVSKIKQENLLLEKPSNQPSSKTNTADKKLSFTLKDNTSLATSIKQEQEKAAGDLQLALRPSTMKEPMIQLTNTALMKLKTGIQVKPICSVRALAKDISTKDKQPNELNNNAQENKRKELKSSVATQPEATNSSPPKAKTPIKSEHKAKHMHLDNKNISIANQSKKTSIMINAVKILPRLNLNSENNQLTKRNNETNAKTIQNGPNLKSSLVEITCKTQKTTARISKRRVSFAVDNSQSMLINKPLRRPSVPPASTQISQLETLKREPLRLESSRAKQQNKRKQISIHNSATSTGAVEAKRTKTEPNASLNFNLTDSVVEILQSDLKTTQLDADSLLKLAEPNSDPYEDILNQVKSEKEEDVKQQNPTNIKTDEANKNDIKAAPQHIRNDMNLLRVVGLPIIKDEHYEDLKPVEFADILRSKAKKFSNMLRLHDTVWNPKKINAECTQNMPKELTMLTKEANAEFKVNLNVSELKRILNLINTWHAQQIDLKFFKKVKISATIGHYLQLFAFLPKINRCFYYCEWCEESSSNKTRYEKHRMMHLCKFTCTHCKRSFQKKGYMLNHMRIMHSLEH